MGAGAVAGATFLAEARRTTGGFGLLAGLLVAFAGAAAARSSAIISRTAALTKLRPKFLGRRYGWVCCFRLVVCLPLPALPPPPLLPPNDHGIVLKHKM